MQTRMLSAPPPAPGRLLLASLGWAVGSWGSWLLVAAVATELLPHSEWLENALLLGGVPLVQAGVWLKAVPRSWQAAQAAASSALMLPTAAWLLLLAGSHLYLLVLFLLGLAFALGDPMQF